MSEVKITFKGASAAVGGVIDEVMVEDPDSGDREVFTRDVASVVDEKFAALVQGEDKASGLEHHSFEVEDVTHELPAKSAKREEWDAAAETVGIDPSLYGNKDDLVQAVEAAA